MGLSYNRLQINSRFGFLVIGCQELAASSRRISYQDDFFYEKIFQLSVKIASDKQYAEHRSKTLAPTVENVDI